MSAFRLQERGGQYGTGGVDCGENSLVFAVIAVVDDPNVLSEAPVGSNTVSLILGLDGHLFVHTVVRVLHCQSGNKSRLSEEEAKLECQLTHRDIPNQQPLIYPAFSYIQHVRPNGEPIPMVKRAVCPEYDLRAVPNLRLG